MRIFRGEPMSTIRPKELESALLKKGFRKTDGGDHNYFFYYIGEEKTKVRTKISRGSHGKKMIGDSLISVIKDQMHFDEKTQLIEFVECTFSKEDYQDLLVNKGVVVIRGP